MLANTDQLPAPAEVNEAARRILESGDFRFGPEEKGDSLKWLISKIEDFLRALGELRETHPALAWALIILCVAILLLIGWHTWTVFARAARAARAKADGHGPAAKRERASQILEAARKAAVSGDIVQALTLYLKAAIAGLDERGIQRRTETATVREYLALLRRHPQERSLLEQFARFYEPGVFGRHPFGPEPMNECDRIARRLAGEGV